MQRRHSHTTSHGSHGSGSWLIFAFFSVLIVLSSFYLFQSYDNIIPTVRLGNWISPAHLQEKQHTPIEEQTQSRTPVVQTSLARTAHAVLLVEIAAMMSSNIHRIHAGYLIEHFFWAPVYCGKGCQSNCDAHAECGNYSMPANKPCPLNVCCSEYGWMSHALPHA